MGMQQGRISMSQVVTIQQQESDDFGVATLDSLERRGPRYQLHVLLSSHEQPVVLGATERGTVDVWCAALTRAATEAAVATALSNPIGQPLGFPLGGHEYPELLRLDSLGILAMGYLEGLVLPQRSASEWELRFVVLTESGSERMLTSTQQQSSTIPHS
eukprot:5210457-Prymnesium_polylepis.2